MGPNDDQTNINGGRKGSVTFSSKPGSTPPDPTPEDPSPTAPEGCLEKYLSCRWVVVYLCVLVYIVQPMLQNCMAMVLVCMESNYIEPPTSDNDNSNHWNGTNSSSPLGETSIWNIRLVGDVRSQLLTAEFYAFPLTPLIGGYLSGKFSAKRVIILIALVMAASSSLTPLVLTFNPYIAIGLRLLVGLSAGGLQSSVTELLSKWAPLKERAQIVSTATAGMLVGFLLNTSTSGFICTIPAHNGWPFIMYIFSGCNFLVLIPWILLVYDSPFEHPRIQANEIKRIRHRRRDSTVAKMPRPPWLDILRSGPFWGLLTAHMGYNFIATTTGTFLPIYLNDVLKLDVTQTGLASSLPPLARILSSLGGGHLSDSLISRGKLSTTAVRKIFLATGNIVSVPFLIGLSYMDGSQASYAVLLLVLFWFIQALNTCSIRVNQIDIAPRFAGVLTGMSGTMAYLSALMSPIVTFQLTKNRTKEEWQVVFFICSGISVFCALVFLVLGSGTEQSWAKDPNFNIEMSVDDITIDISAVPLENKSRQGTVANSSTLSKHGQPDADGLQSNGQPPELGLSRRAKKEFDHVVKKEISTSSKGVQVNIIGLLITEDAVTVCPEDRQESRGIINKGFAACEEDLTTSPTESIKL